MKKKLFIFSLVLVMMTMFMGATALAADNQGLEFSFDKAAVAPGEEVTVTVYMTDYNSLFAKDISGLQVDVSFDEGIFTYVPDSATYLLEATGAVKSIAWGNVARRIKFIYSDMVGSLARSETPIVLFSFAVKAADDLTAAGNSTEFAVQFKGSYFSGEMFDLSSSIPNVTLAIDNTPAELLDAPVFGYELVAGAPDFALLWGQTPAWNGTAGTMIWKYDYAEDPNHPYWGMDEIVPGTTAFLQSLLEAIEGWMPAHLTVGDGEPIPIYQITNLTISGLDNQSNIDVNGVIITVTHDALKGEVMPEYVLVFPGYVTLTHTAGGGAVEDLDAPIIPTTPARLDLASAYEPASVTWYPLLATHEDYCVAITDIWLSIGNGDEKKLDAVHAGAPAVDGFEYQIVPWPYDGDITFRLFSPEMNSFTTVTDLLAAGYTLRIQADGYKEQIVKVDAPPAPSAAPALTNGTTATVGDDVVLGFMDNAAWRAAITSIKIDGTAIDMGTLAAVAAGEITLDSSLFATAGSYEITVSATNYVDAVITVGVDAPPAPPKDFPVFSGIPTNFTQIFSSMTWVFSPSTENKVLYDEYLSAFTGVWLKVGDGVEKYFTTPYVTGGGVSIYVDFTSSLEVSSTDLAGFADKDSLLTAGYSMRIVAAGYKDQTIGWDGPPPLKDFPVLSNAPNSLSKATATSPTTISWALKKSGHGAYLEAITAVYLSVGNGTEISLAKLDGTVPAVDGSGFYAYVPTSSSNIALYIYSAEMNAFMTVADLTAAGYSARIVATGYKDQTVGFAPPAPSAAPVLAYATTATVGEDVVLGFTDNAAWRAAITSIKIDGTAIDMGTLAAIVAGEITLDSSLFATAGSYTITVSATNYVDAVITVGVDEANEEHTYSVEFKSEDKHYNVGDTVKVEVWAYAKELTNFGAFRVKFTFDNALLAFSTQTTSPVYTTGLSGNEITMFYAMSGPVTIGPSGVKLGTFEFTVRDAVDGNAAADFNFTVAKMGLYDNNEYSETPTLAGAKLSVPLHNLKITFDGGNTNLGISYAYAKYNEAGLYTSNNYTTAFVVPTATGTTGPNYRLPAAGEPQWTDGVNDYLATALSTTYTGSVTYTHITITRYGYTFYNAAGEVIETLYLESGTVTAPAAPAVTGKDFKGWFAVTAGTDAYDGTSTLYGDGATAFPAITDATALNSAYKAYYENSSFDITLPDAATDITGVVNDKATYGTDVTFKLTDLAPGARVTYQVGDGEEQTMTAVGGVYTIPGGEITGEVVVRIYNQIRGTVEFIEYENYKGAKVGEKVMLFRPETALADGTVFLYDGTKELYWSSAYSAYVAFVPVTETIDGALFKITVTSGTLVSIRYDGDVTGNGELDEMDAMNTYKIYNRVEADNITDLMRFEADVNGDRAVDTMDAFAILMLL